MELLFLIALLAVVVWLNRGILGFSRGPSWMRSDTADENGQWKWICSHCGTVKLTDGDPPPAHECG